MCSGFRVLRVLLDSWQDWQGVAIAAMVLFPLLGMLTYIAGISLLARFESRPADVGSMKWFASLLLLFPLLTHSAMWVGFHYLSLDFNIYGTWPGVCGILPFLAWTLYAICAKTHVGQKVARLLAGIVLVDSVFWCPMGWAIYVISGYEYLFWLSLTPLLAFVLALLLQKIAPAT